MNKSTLLGCEPARYPNSHVLVNKLNIHNSKELAVKESNATLIRAWEIFEDEHLLNLSFDFNMLQNIHFHLFKDIYEWAGRPRNYECKKEMSIFTPPHMFEHATEVIFSKVTAFLQSRFKESDTKQLADIFVY